MSCLVVCSPDYINRLQLHEEKAVTNPEPLDRKLSGRLKQTTPNRMKWVRAESREEQECDRLRWKLIAQETRKPDNSLWCLWTDPEVQYD
jgi:hypothetical protein